MTAAYRSLSTVVGTVISLLTMPMVTTVAILIFDEPFRWTILFGGILIFLSAISVTLLKMLYNRKISG
jgi:drug/metabolite transporter (DMT)-like permease